MKNHLFTLLISLFCIQSYAQTSRLENEPIIEVITLESTDFSIKPDYSFTKVLHLDTAFFNVDLVSINIAVFTKKETKLIEAYLEIDEKQGEEYKMTRDSHVENDTTTVFFSPFPIGHGLSNCSISFNSEFVYADSVQITIVGFQKETSSMRTAHVPDIEKDYTNCQCSIPNYTDRNGWGCPQGAWGTTATIPTHLVIHHEAAGGATPNTSSNWANRVWSIWNYHVNTLNWSDIGYNWLIDPNGVIYEGRYSSSFGDPQGAHWVCNPGSMAICMLGNYSSATITAQAKESLEKLLAWKACQFSIDPQGDSYNSAQMAVLDNICGHLNGPCANTSCPGSQLYGQIPSIRSGVISEINACSGNPEDIFITNTSISQTTLIAGDNFTVYATQNYSGSQLDANLPSFDLDYYLSTDCNLDNSDVLLGGDVSGLGSDDPFNDENESLTIPLGTSSGIYYILFAADNDDELAESNENNNLECIQITIGATPSEDIFLTNVSISQTSLSPGDLFTVYATQNYSGNQLDANLPSFDLDYYLSIDCNLDNNDILLGGDVSGIGSDDPFQDENENLIIPMGTSFGTYYILFVADNDDELVESNENNNVECVQITVGTSPEDIFLTNVSLSQNSMSSGDNVTAYATQNYSGNQLDINLPSFNLDYYLSTDCTLDNNDVLLGGDVSGIGSDAPFEDEDAVLTIPIGTSSGVYYILFVADNDDELAESNENNNVECIQITVNEISNEDILVSNTSTSLQIIESGTTVFVTVNQTYFGVQTASNLPDVSIGYYLSADCNKSADDIYIGGDFSNIGSDISTEIETADLLVPLSTLTGDYFILFVGDDDDYFQENDEQNNISCVDIEVVNIVKLEDVSNEDFIVYPNPVDDILYIENVKDFEIRLLDPLGRLVVKQLSSSDLNQIDMSNCASGVYALQLIKGNIQTIFRVVKL
ncbi:MAG: CARDB domain-containing protein [Crocinitomicaceae bacterium]|nr:CARDB domain-containing protein [Crocinitomicaceae bacterium]